MAPKKNPDREQALGVIEELGVKPICAASASGASGRKPLRRRDPAPNLLIRYKAF
jgi:hypothetical protein